MSDQIAQSAVQREQVEKELAAELKIRDFEELGGTWEGTIWTALLAARLRLREVEQERDTALGLLPGKLMGERALRDEQCRCFLERAESAEQEVKDLEGMSHGLFPEVLRLRDDLRASEKSRQELMTLCRRKSAELLEWENREAAVCPEDVGFEEIISVQHKRAQSAEFRLAEAEQERDELLAQAWKLAEAARHLIETAKVIRGSTFPELEAALLDFTSLASAPTKEKPE